MYNGIRYLALVFVIYLLPFVSDTHASTIFIAEVTVDSLNVREVPSTKGKVIGSLKKGEQVIATPSYSGWAMTLLNGKTPGYFSSKYIKIVRVISSEKSSSYGDEEEIKCNADSANLSLNISNVDFKCKEDLFGEGFKSCSAWFDVSISSDCDESMNAYVYCEAEFEYETKDGFMPSRATRTGSGSVIINYRHGTASIEVHWRPGWLVILDHVIKVKLNDGSCSITSVYDY